ncbi:MAG: MFS transporter [Pirellulaceae bacterium]|nr:MFS transporter [Pirellulaceae bacterium]
MPPPPDPRRWSQLAWLAAIELLAMSLWFSASAVTKTLAGQWQLSPGSQAWLTISVQVGFVIGALASAVLNLSERISPTKLLAWCALGGALANAAIPLAIGDEFGRTSVGLTILIGLRVLTGVMLAGVYPTGMKLMATWFVQGRGLAIGILVGALTIGSASPHLVYALASWRMVLLGASAAALIAAVLAALFARVGPHLPAATRFDLGYFARIWADPAVRRANFGYLGHMFELYAMWAWAPRLLADSYHAAHWSEAAAKTASFATVAIGGAGCVLAGFAAERVGRCWTTTISLALSGGCALVVGWLIDHPALLTIVCLLWGLAVIADSAQFSAAVSELCDPQFVGTALTIQTCAGFLLTTLTIRAVPTLEHALGWNWAFALLALGPLFGIYHMLRLRASPAAAKLAGGRG